MRSETRLPNVFPTSSLRTYVQDTLALIALGLAVAAAPVGAETLVDAYGLGPHEPKPEEWTRIDEELSVRAQVVDAATGELAAEVRPNQSLRLDLAFYAQPESKDREVRLVCSVYFYDAEGEASEYHLMQKPCYEGRLHDALDRFQPLTWEFRFRHKPGDPAGTSAVVVNVEDLVIDEGLGLTPTYRLSGS
ncbi:MAG: hypothetical protein RLZZ528_2792 [Pseudomonadota bacterium]